ncbi:hypothetical protein B0H16DRAFT_1460094 [Mycena metata]|uniref:WW domain-containing protein n=1 Tax=Mycena metata TaxID=1033252 RepID=A0AAD7GMX1_9AGAR|nr:hypothetical protein B0H16DRAFT_1748273 [Mycena metata]KAJ7752113.1 hypothetical protein B0H16DRAFT_1460094 [Mycena metata]
MSMFLGSSEVALARELTPPPFGQDLPHGWVSHPDPIKEHYRRVVFFNSPSSSSAWDDPEVPADTATPSGSASAWESGGWGPADVTAVAAGSASGWGWGPADVPPFSTWAGSGGWGDAAAETVAHEQLSVA